MKNNVNSKDFWNDCYANNQIGWDLGKITPVFKDWCDKLTENKSIFVPGSGNGYDPLYFAKKGHNVTAVDFSSIAVENMSKKAISKNIDINILKEDIFNLNSCHFSQYDYVVEYTCFCAIDPNKRLDYIKIMNDVLVKNGELVGLFLPLLKDKSEGGPPFSVNLEEILEQFSKYFKVVKSIKHPLSIKSRFENEQYIHFKKIY